MRQSRANESKLECNLRRANDRQRSLGREQVRLSRRLLSIELVTGSVRLNGEQMKLSKGLVISAK